MCFYSTFGCHGIVNRTVAMSLGRALMDSTQLLLITGEWVAVQKWELLNTVERVLPVVSGWRLNIYSHAVSENLPAVKLGLFAGMLAPSSVSCLARCCYLTIFKIFKGVLRTWPPSSVSVYSTCWGFFFLNWNMTSVMSSCMIKCCVDICRFDKSRHAGMCSVQPPTAL